MNHQEIAAELLSRMLAMGLTDAQILELTKLIGKYAKAYPKASPGQSNVKENASSPEATFIPAGSERTPAIDALSLSDTEERA